MALQRDVRRLRGEVESVRLISPLAGFFESTTEPVPKRNNNNKNTNISTENFFK